MVGKCTRLFVTSRVELAAFDDRVPFLFAVFDDCVELLQCTDPPSAGFFVPKWAARLMAAERSSKPRSQEQCCT